MCNFFFLLHFIKTNLCAQKFLRALKDRLVLKIRVASDRLVDRCRKLPVASRKGQPDCRTKSKGVTTQMKALNEFFLMVVFVFLDIETW